MQLVKEQYATLLLCFAMPLFPRPAESQIGQPQGFMGK